MDKILIAKKLIMIAKILTSGMLRSPTRIEAIMKKHGMKVEDGELMFGLLLPSGSFDMNTIARTYRSVEKAKYGEIAIDKSINQEYDYYSDVYAKIFELKTFVEKNNTASAKKVYDSKIVPIIRTGVRVEEKKKMNDHLTEIGNILKTDMMPEQVKELQIKVEELFDTGSKLVDRFEKQRAESKERLKVVESLLHMEKKNPHLLQQISTVSGQVNKPIEDTVKQDVVHLRGGLISDITKQVADAIKHRQQLSFMYRKDTGPEKRQVIPKKLEKLPHGMAVLAWNPERNGFGRYHFNKIV